MSCRHESAVLRAAREDQWSDTLRRHFLECDDCVAAAAVSPWMNRFARIGDREHPLPDPQIVWLKARVLQASSDAARVARPMTIVQIVSYCVVAAGWAALLTWKFDVVSAWLRGLTPTGIVQNVTRAESLSMSFFGIVFILASMTVMLALHTILAEE
ncbi:MAG TPA: hypothetical protein VND45_10150 [Thermoanaerobaculia bacterium]|jgi:hypothetical protein|nr:hypothetical protein [Thermoanaerobaculia bacterium]